MEAIMDWTATTLASVGFAILIGVSCGLLAGLSGGVVDGILMRIADIQLAFPSVLLATLLPAIEAEF